MIFGSTGDHALLFIIAVNTLALAGLKTEVLL